MLLVEWRSRYRLTCLCDVRLILSRDSTLVRWRALELLLLFVEDLRAWIDKGWFVTRNNNTWLVWVLATNLSRWLRWWSQIDIGCTIFLHGRSEPILILVLLSSLIIWRRFKFLRFCLSFVRLDWSMQVITVCSWLAYSIFVVSNLFLTSDWLTWLTFFIPLRSWHIILHVMISIVSVVIAL